MIITGRPIVKKNNRQLVKSKGRTFFVPSAAFKRFKGDALTELSQYSEQYEGPIKVELTFQMKGKLDTDIDNMVSSILDILEGAEIIDNDSNVFALKVNKYKGFEDWKTIINITSLSNNEVSAP